VSHIVPTGHGFADELERARHQLREKYAEQLNDPSRKDAAEQEVEAELARIEADMIRESVFRWDEPFIR
jgi:hypothetical protein